jgi:hypothetical protein
VYLEKSWFLSGEDEMLGVVLWQGDPPTEADVKEHSPHVTLWGQDPIWGARAITAPPRREDFRNAIPEQSDGIPFRETVSLPNTGKQFSVLGFPVEEDKDRGLWRCDIELAPRSYFSFIRFALVRYQPFSIADCHASEVAQADFIQLFPDRSAVLQYTPDPRSIRLSVAGVSYVSVSGAAGMPQRRSSRMRVRVEEQFIRPRTGLAWRPVGDLDQSPSIVKADGSAEWNFDISLRRSRKSTKYRLVVEEYEQLPVDLSDALQDIAKFGFGPRTSYVDVLGV